MNASPLLAGFAFALAASPTLRADEARASVYLLDRSEEYAATGGACLPYQTSDPPGPSREILALAESGAGSVVLMVAFAGDAPHLRLTPVLAEQGDESKPVRFPAEGERWTFDSAKEPVNFYIAVFDKADPELAKLAEDSASLAEALKSKNETEILLRSEAMQKRLRQFVRQQGGSELSARLGGAITASREASSSKAATTRNGTAGGFPNSLSLAASLAPKRRGLKTLDSEWREDSRAIPFGLAKPGVLVVPIAATP